MQTPKNMKLIKRSALLLFIFSIACTAAEILPVDIDASDMCEFCKMAISQKQFAAELITKDEKVLKFDDIGCLLKWKKRSDSDADLAAIFVVDHSSGQWMKAQDGIFVRSDKVQTPMNGGIIAFSDKASAESFDPEAQILRFNDLSVP